MIIDFYRGVFSGFSYLSGVVQAIFVEPFSFSEYWQYIAAELVVHIAVGYGFYKTG